MSVMWKFLWLVAGLTCLQGIMACYTNFISNGSTEPLGDITLPLGSELVINCTLNDRYGGPKNSGDIYWVINKKVVPSQYVTILDERSAQLRIGNISAEYCGKLSCKLKPGSTLCMNSVTLVAPIPKQDELNFSCTSYQWKSIKCEWKLGPKCPRTAMSISTNWTLSYSKHLGRVYCSKYLEDKNGWYTCVFDETTVPTYDVFMVKFFWILMAKTPFEEREFNFTVDHFSRVIASPPKTLRNSSYESTKLKLVWDVSEEFKLFPVPLVYQLKYRSEWDQSDYLKEIFNETSFEIENLIPYTKYSVWLRCRSQTVKDEDMWSTYISETFQTLSAVPVSHVNTTPSNFIDIRSVIDKRSVTLFWTPIPPSQHFGPNFHYIIWRHSEGDRNISSITNDSSFSYGPVELLSNKSYWFKIQAANELGASPNVETIFIDKLSEKPSEAEDLTIYHVKSGAYNISWKPPKSQPLVISYFVVWCKGSSFRSRSQPCYAPLVWTSVPANETSRIITVDDKSENSIYHFGVAVNTNVGTSGLKTWSKCIAPYDGIPGKMKMNSLIVESSTSIRVDWALDCSQQLGVISGFQVQYCSSLNHQNDNCEGEIYKVTVDGAEKRSFSIKDLKPYTYYQVMVAGIAKRHVGEASDPQTKRTKQDAPFDPPNNLTSPFVSNASISVHWGLPTMPNGVLTHFLVHYNNSFGIVQLKNVSFEDGKYGTDLKEKIECYTNYTITAQACTVSGCSPHSQLLTVLTKIGVPGQPEMRKAHVFNYTHIVLEWDGPIKPNGPIEQWNLFVIKYTEDETENSTTEDVHSSPFSFPIQCDKDQNMKYSFAVQAVTKTTGHEKLMSEWSDLATFNVCPPTSIMGLSITNFIFVSVFGALAFILVIGLGCYCYKSVVPKFIKIRNITADLPVGLIKDGKIGYNDFEKKLNQSTYSSVDDSVSVKVLNRLQSISSDDGRGSQNSTETTLHETSSFSSINDENMYTDKTNFGHFRNKHNLSSDSSGCSTGEGSISSTVTTRMHLSSDSGNEADLPTPVTSLDSVFYDVGTWPAGITSSSQLRLRTLQRLGEEDCVATFLNGERLDTCQPEEDFTQFSPNHYYKPAIKKSDSDAAVMKTVGIDSGPNDESNETKTSASPLTSYSRLALIAPPQSNDGYQKSETAVRDSDAKDLKMIDSICANPESSKQEEWKRPASYVALANLSDTSRVQAVAPSEQVVSGQTNELTPYSRVGLVTKPPAVSLSDENQINKMEPLIIANCSAHKMELPDVSVQHLGTKDVTHLPIVPCPTFKKDSQRMPSQRSEQATNNENQKKPKRPSYIALARIEDPSGSRMCQSGYSKVGQRDTLATSCLPKAVTNGPSVPVDKAENVRRNESPSTPIIHRYVTLGLMNPGSLKETTPPDMADVEPAPNGCKLNFDVTLAGAGPCNGGDGSSWESELEISEENLTEEDLHSVVQQPSSMYGYVCLGMPQNEGAKGVI